MAEGPRDPHLITYSHTMKNAAFTLIEMLICLIIISLLAAMSIFSYRELSDKIQSEAIKVRVLGLIHFAQRTAYNQRKQITWCQSQDLKKCSSRYGQQVLFIGSKNDEIIHKQNIIAAEKFKGHLHWQGFPAKQKYLIFLPDRLNSNNNSTIWYCRNNTIKWAIFLSKSSRVRLAYPDRDGTIVDSRKRLLLCE